MGPGANFSGNATNQALFDLIAGSIFAGADQPGDLMLTTKQFAGLAAMLTVLVFVVRLRGLPPVLVYLNAIAALTCGVFAFTYFIAERWMKTPLRETLGLAQVGFIAASAVAFGLTAYVYPLLSSRTDAVSYYVLVALLGVSVAGYSVGCGLFALNATWAIIRYVRLRPQDNQE